MQRSLVFFKDYFLLRQKSFTEHFTYLKGYIFFAPKHIFALIFARTRKFTTAPQSPRKYCYFGGFKSVSSKIMNDDFILKIL